MDPARQEIEAPAREEKGKGREELGVRSPDEQEVDVLGRGIVPSRAEATRKSWLGEEDSYFDRTSTPEQTQTRERARERGSAELRQMREENLSAMEDLERIGGSRREIGGLNTGATTLVRRSLIPYDRKEESVSTNPLLEISALDIAGRDVRTARPETFRPYDTSYDDRGRRQRIIEDLEMSERAEQALRGAISRREARERQWQERGRERGRRLVDRFVGFPQEGRSGVLAGGGVHYEKVLSAGTSRYTPRASRSRLEDESPTSPALRLSGLDIGGCNDVRTTGDGHTGGELEDGSSVSRVQPRSSAPGIYRDSGDNLWQGGSARNIAVPQGLSDVARRGRGGGDSDDEQDQRRDRRLGYMADAVDVEESEEEDEEGEHQEPEVKDRRCKKTAKPTFIRKASKAMQKAKAMDTTARPPAESVENRPRDFGSSS